MDKFDVAVIGAGPAGAAAAALLNRQGWKVCVLEKQYFPRFVIGESLLPYCTACLEEAGLLSAVLAEPSFQLKNGAAFSWGGRYSFFDFADKFSAGPATTVQVRRDRFDHILIREAEKQGVEVRFACEVTAFDNTGEGAILQIKPQEGVPYALSARFVLDASGYGRVLPRLLDLDRPSDFPVREAHFTHIDDHISDADYDRNKILVGVHPENRDIWLWLIPFADGRCSIGVVGLSEYFADFADSEQIVQHFAAQVPLFARILRDAVWDNGVPYRSLKAYSANVKALHGRHFALLGNAAEFLDPVFSSGVTIALHSAKLAAALLGKQLAGKIVDWEKEFSEPLKVGVDTFRSYVSAWYDGRFQDVIFSDVRTPEISRMLSSILAGYAWDTDNPFVAKAERRLNVLAELAGKAEYR